MNKVLMLLVVVALCVAVVPVRAQEIGPESDIVLFSSGFEFGDIREWNGVGGNPYDIQVLSWWLCQIVTGSYCARTGAYGAGQRAYLIETSPSWRDSDWYAQWRSSVYTYATPSQPSTIFRLVSDLGVILMELRVQYSNSNARVRLYCKDFDDPQYMKYSSWLAMPKSWNGVFGATFRVGWHKGDINTGGCWMDMYDDSGNKTGAGMLYNTGNWNLGKVLIGVVTNPGTGETQQWLDDYQGHSIR